MNSASLSCATSSRGSAFAILLTCALLPSTSSAQGLDPQPVAAAGLAGIGSALASMRTAVMNDEPAAIRDDLAVSFRWAAAEARMAADGLQELANGGGQVGGFAIYIFQTLELDFVAAKNGVLAADYGAARYAMSDAATMVRQLSRDRCFGAGAPHFATAADSIQDLADTLAGMDPNDRLPGFVAVAQDLRARGLDPSVQLQADALLGTSDPRVRLLLHLDDPETADALRRLGRLCATRDFLALCRAIELNPATYVVNMLSIGAGASAMDAGDELVAGGQLALGVGGSASLLGGCPDDCGPGAPCASCSMCGEGIGTGSCDPDDLRKYDKALTVVGLAANKATVGMSKAAAKATKGLIKLLQNRRPRCYVLICWEVCEEVSCWLFWDRYKCVAHSEWVEVFPAGNPALSWGSFPWSPAEASDYDQQSAAAAAAACAGH